MSRPGARRRAVLGWLKRHRDGLGELLQALAASGALAAATHAVGRPALANAAAWPLLLGLQLSVFRVFRLHRRSWRTWGARDLLGIGLACGVAAGAAAAAATAAGGPFPGWGWVLVDASFAFAALAGLRAGVRVVLETAARPAPARRILVYGAGRAGAALLGALRTHPELGRSVAGFVDDDPAKRGRVVDGVPVLGCGREIGGIAARTGAHEVILAMPSVAGGALAAARERCAAARLVCRVLPRLAAQLGGNSGEDAEPEALLGRPPAALESSAEAGALEGRTVLVTGAAGSIGSELCRQLERCRPARLIAFDQAESGLFRLEQETGFSPGVLVTEVGDLRDAARVDGLLARYRPEIVFHAAALKQVPLMERHPFEALATNTLASADLAAACHRRGVQRLVLISTDKAVAPASVMGATKFLAERICLGLSGPASVVAVRFGNVLGSQGSVVPAFRRQIELGGPIRITHPEMRRFLMTIPEAAQLLLYAAGGEAGREVLVLRMGEPVRIVDLAVRMLSLEGLEPSDVPIAFTGVRPGEKLDEELVAPGEVMLASSHPLIGRVQAAAWDDRRARQMIARIRAITAGRDTAALEELWREAVPEFAQRCSTHREIADGNAGGSAGYDPVESRQGP